jgi:hypothetical protein
MAGAPVLTMAAQIMCPHGGQAIPVPSNPGVLLMGAPVLCETDTFPIVGCTFNVLGVPTPCLMVQWTVPALTFRVNGAAGLLATSIGLCVGGSGALPAIVTPGQFLITAV